MNPVSCLKPIFCLYICIIFSMLLYQTVTQLCIFHTHFECNGSLQVNHGRCLASVPITDISAIAFHITHLSYTTCYRDFTYFYLVALFMRANIIIYRTCICIAYLNSARYNNSLPGSSPTTAINSCTHTLFKLPVIIDCQPFFHC